MISTTIARLTAILEAFGDVPDFHGDMLPGADIVFEPPTDDYPMGYVHVGEKP